MKITCKLIIFDLDGTLIDTIEDLGNAMNAVLAHHSFPVHPINSYKKMVGWGISNLVKRALPKGSSKIIIENCVNEMLKEYKNNCLNKSKPYSGIIELIHELRDHNILIVTLSNKPDELTNLIVKKLLPSELFKVIQGAKKDIPHKPSPDSVFSILNRLQINNDEAILVGDSGIDMQTAKSAGVFPVGVLWGFKTREELIANGAQVLLKKPIDLLKLLE